MNRILLAAVPMLLFTASGSLCMVLNGEAVSPVPDSQPSAPPVGELADAAEG